MNSRDMEDAAIHDVGSERSQRCYEALKAIGGGEKGLMYVELNRMDEAERKAGMR